MKVWFLEAEFIYEIPKYQREPDYVFAFQALLARKVCCRPDSALTNLATSKFLHIDDWHRGETSHRGIQLQLYLAVESTL